MDHSGCTPLHHACINAPDGHRSVKVSQSRQYFVCKMPFHGYFMWMSLILLASHIRGAGNVTPQRAKKVMSDSPGLVDFAIGLVIFVLNLPDGQVLFFWEIQITEGL